MAYPAVAVGTGTSVTLNIGGAVNLGEVTSIQLSGVEVGTIDTTHLGTTDARTFMPSDLYDGGTVSIEAHWNPENGLPIGGGTGSCAIILRPRGTPVRNANITFQCFVQSVEIGTPLEEKMVASVTLKVTGPVTVTVTNG